MITSSSNGLIKRIRKLEQKKFRTKEGVGFVEGLRGVLTAAERASHLIEKVVISPDLLTGERSEFRLRELVGDDQIVEISADLFRSIANRENPAGMGAIVQTPIQQANALPATGRFVILDRISDPGNLGTIIRTADAAGMSGVILVGPGADVMHASALKASLGTVFTVPLFRISADELENWKSANNLLFVGTSAKATADYRAIKPSADFSLLLGNEREGLSDALAKLADETVSIPMAGQASSLNLAVAAGILMFETMTHD